MSEYSGNPFQPIYDQMNRMESMIIELKQKLEERDNLINNEDDNGIEMAVRVTGYAKSTIYVLVNRREIPHTKHRGVLRFDEKELRDWKKGRPRLTAAQARKAV